MFLTEAKSGIQFNDEKQTNKQMYGNNTRGVLNPHNYDLLPRFIKKTKQKKTYFSQTF